MSAVYCTIAAGALAALPEAKSVTVDNIPSAKARTRLAAGRVSEGIVGTSANVVSACNCVGNGVSKMAEAVLHTNMTFEATKGVLGSEAAAWLKPVTGLDLVVMVRIACWNHNVCHDAMRYMYQ